MKVVEAATIAFKSVQMGLENRRLHVKIDLSLRSCNLNGMFSTLNFDFKVRSKQSHLMSTGGVDFVEFRDVM
jgi:hypothetical protein